MRRRQDLATSSWPRMARTTPGLFDDFDQLVESVLAPVGSSLAEFQPDCDINETDEHYHISFDMPGVKKEDINIEMENDILTIFGERRHETREGEGTSRVRRERSYGSFQRTFRLPSSVDGDKIEANYDDGVLEVLVPKAESAKGKKVQVQSGKSGFFSKLLGEKKSESKESKAS